MFLYSNQEKYFKKNGILLKKEIGLFPLDLEKIYKDSEKINLWKEVI